METNYVKTRILPILDEINAYLYNKSRFKKNNQPRKNSIFQLQVAKKVRNLRIFGDVIAHVRKQLQKIAHFIKSAGLDWTGLCRNKANSLHVGPGPAGDTFRWGFSKGS